MTARCLLLLGAPGSGKGTQASLLANSLGLSHLSLGDSLRRHVAQQGRHAIEGQQSLEAGLPVRVTLMTELIRDSLIASHALTTGFVGDGLVRTLEQANALDNLLSELGMQLNSVFYLDVSREELVYRLLRRLTCAICGYTWSPEAAMESTFSTCPIDGSLLTKRFDDSEEIIAKRLAVHAKTVDEILAFYEGKSILKRVDGQGTRETIHAELLRQVRM
jgi:adenylate kinase